MTQPFNGQFGGVEIVNGIMITPRPIVKGNKKPCCQDESNLIKIDSGRDDTVIKECTVCNCKHYVVRPEKFTLGLKGTALGT